jgi:hypothetical protein
MKARRGPGDQLPLVAIGFSDTEHAGCDTGAASPASRAQRCFGTPSCVDDC